MSFNALVRKVISVAESTSVDVDIVEGLRSEDLPAPCISVHLESAMNFNQSLTDVFNVVITVKYEEHHADQPSGVVNDNFKKLLDAFVVNNITSKLNAEGTTVFNAKVTDVSTAISGDFFVNQFSLELIAERDS